MHSNDDAQCKGDLRCWQRDGDAPLAPGCTGIAQGDLDMCWDPYQAKPKTSAGSSPGLRVVIDLPSSSVSASAALVLLVAAALVALLCMVFRGRRKAKKVKYAAVEYSDSDIEAKAFNN